MKCTTCGAFMGPITTDLPFKVGDHSIVVIKDVPVLQCSACPEYLLSDPDMERVEQILSAHHKDVELEVVRFAA
jgi:YgiT-type zinc finger domain-containing protein